MNQTFAYTRDDKRLELNADAQLSRIRGLVDAQGWEFTKHFHDTADDWLQPMFKRAEGARLADLASHGDAIIAYSAACLSYSATDFGTIVEWFQRKRVAILLVNETLRLAKSATDLARVVAGELADGEKRRTYLNARTREAQQEEGRYMGGRVPFGWRTGEDGILIPDEQQQIAIAKMRAQRESGLSYRAIADEMVKEGIRISHQGVKRALTSDRDLK